MKAQQPGGREPAEAQADAERTNERVSELRALAQEAEAVVLETLEQETPVALAPLDAALQARLRQTVAAARPLTLGQRLRRWFQVPSLVPRPLWVPALGALLIGVGLYLGGAAQGEAPLAGYELVLRREDAVLGEPAAAPAAGVVEVHGDTPLELIIRPRGGGVQEPLEAAAFLRATASDAGAGWQLWPVTLQRHPGGVFQLKAQTQALPGLKPGAYEIAVVVARRGQLPTLAQLRANLNDPQRPVPPRLQLLRRALVVKASQPG